MKLLIIPGSLRKESFNKKMAAAAEQIAKKIGFTTTLIHLDEFEIPVLNQDDSDTKPFPQDVQKMHELFKSHDAFLFVTPEYNASIPGGLKNVIDWASRSQTPNTRSPCFINKVAAIMSASVSPYGGLRAISHLRQVLTILNVLVIPQEKTLPSAHEVFSSSSGIESHLKGMENVLSALFSLTSKTSNQSKS